MEWHKLAASSRFACEIITAGTAASTVGAQRQAALTPASDKPLSDKGAALGGQGRPLYGVRVYPTAHRTRL